MPKKKNKGGGAGGVRDKEDTKSAAAAAAAEIVSAGAPIKAASSGFRFQDGVVEDDMVKDLKSLKALSAPQLKAMVSMSLEFLTSSDGI